MKRIVLLLFTLISIEGFSQTHTIGIVEGVNFTNTTGGVSAGVFNNRKAELRGVDFLYLYPRKIFLGVDAFYNKQGYTVVFSRLINKSLPITNMYVNYNFDYLSIPLKAGYQLGNKVYGFITIGIMPSVLIKAEQERPTFNSKGFMLPAESFFIKETNIKKFDLSCNMETGVGVNLYENFDLFSSVSFRKSITKFAKNDYKEFVNMKYYGYLISIGLKYRIDRDKSAVNARDNGVMPIQ